MAKLREIYAENRVIVLKLILFSLLLMLFPLLVFSITYFGVFAASPERVAWSGVSSVVALNLVIMGYVVMAWNEGTGDGDHRHVNPEENKVNGDDKKTN